MEPIDTRVSFLASPATKIGLAYYSWAVTLAAVAGASAAGVSARHLTTIALFTGPLSLLTVLVWSSVRRVPVSNIRACGELPESAGLTALAESQDRMRRATALRNYAARLAQRAEDNVDGELIAFVAAIDRLARDLEAGAPELEGGLTPEDFIREFERRVLSRSDGHGKQSESSGERNAG